jgi:hypothetical protein
VCFLSNSIKFYLEAYAKNPSPFSNTDGFDHLNICIISLSCTRFASRIVWEIGPIRAQLAHPIVPYVYKKGPAPLTPALPTTATVPTFVLICFQKIAPTQSNDGEDRSPSAQPLGGKGPVHLVIWTLLPILVEYGWPPEIVRRTRAVTCTDAAALRPPKGLFLLHMLDIVVCHAICDLVFSYLRSGIW